MMMKSTENAGEVNTFGMCRSSSMNAMYHLYLREEITDFVDSRDLKVFVERF